MMYVFVKLIYKKVCLCAKEMIKKLTTKLWCFINVLKINM